MTISSGLPSGCAACDHSAEVRVAYVTDFAFVCARDHVWTGAGYRVCARGVDGRTGRNRRSRDPGQLVEEVGIRRAQVEGDRARGVVGHDPAPKIASLGGAGARTADAGVVTAGSGKDPEEPLDRPPEVGGADDAPVPVADLLWP